LHGSEWPDDAGVPSKGTDVNDIVLYVPAALSAIKTVVDLYQITQKALDKHYQHQPPVVRGRALNNAVDTAERLRKKIDALIELGQVTAEQADEAFGSPDFALMLQRAIIDGSESASAFKHESLATLVAQRLNVGTESEEALVLRRAGQVVADLSERQLHLLALIYAVGNVEPDLRDEGGLQERVDAAVVDIENMLKPFDGLEIKYVDLSHLAGLGLIEFKPHVGHGMYFGHDANQAKAMQFISRHFQMAIHTNPEPFRCLADIMQGNTAEGRPGLQATRTLPVGWVLGRSVYCQLTGEAFSFRWD
jgi:hypothetical protein